MVYTRHLKCRALWACGFESRLRYQPKRCEKLVLSQVRDRAPQTIRCSPLRQRTNDALQFRIRHLRVAEGGWQIENGKWRIENGELRMGMGNRK